jgi:hypothetical protein
VNDEKVKDPADIASAFSNFFTTITEKLTFRDREKRTISILKDSFPGNFPSIKIIPVTKADKKCTTFLLLIIYF